MGIFMNKTTFYYDRLNDTFNGNIKAAPSIEIDLTNKCSKNCYYCNSSHVKNVKDIAKDTNYIRLINSIPKEVKTITFAGGGEPLEKISAPLIIHYALWKGFKVGLITTGNKLNTLHIHVNPADKYLSWVGVDVDSGNPIDYKKMGKGKLFLELINSLKTEIKKLNEKGVVTTFKYLVNDYNNSIEKVEEAIKLAKKLNFQEFFMRVAFFKNKLLNLKINQQQVIDICIEQNIKYNISFFKQKEYIKLLSKKEYQDFCYAPLLNPLFAADGKIYWCCEQRGNEEYVIGNWLKDGYKPLLDNSLLEKIKKFKDLHKCNSYCRYVEYNKFTNSIFNNTLDSKSGHKLGFF